MTNLSPLQIERLKYQPKLPASLANGINQLSQLQIKKKLKLYSRTLTANQP